MTDSCTKYYALCTERNVQTSPILVNDSEKTSCRNGIIVSAASCSWRTSCSENGIQCTDSEGTYVTESCSSYYMECLDGTLGPVMPVATGSKCLNNAIVLNSECSSAECTFTNIQCTNGAGDWVNTYCTGFFVECVDGTVSSPIAVPAGTQCYQNQIVVEGTCVEPTCSFEGIRCADSAGTLVANSCTSYFVECDNGFFTDPHPVADGTQCYNDAIILSEQCAGSTCSDASIVCSDTNGIILTDTCTGYFRQCVDGVYNTPELVPSGTSCKNGEIILSASCQNDCSDTRRCTDNIGTPITNSCTKYYQSCVDGTYNPVQNTEPSMSCLNGDLIPDSQCSDPTYECDFTGIKCSTSDGTLVSSTCSEYYVQCEFGSYTTPRRTASGTMCYNNEQVDASSCAAQCSWEGVRCSDYSGNIITDRCTGYYAECDNGLQTKARPVAEGTKCLNGELVNSNTCSTPVCTQGDLVCSDENGVAETTSCTDYFMVCDNGLYVTPQPVAYGTKCRQGQIVLSSNCTGIGCDYAGIKCSDADGVIYENSCRSYYVQCENGQNTAPQPVANGTRCMNGMIVKTEQCSYQDCDFTGIKCSDANGIVYTNECTSYFLECGEAGLTQPMPVAAGTRCYQNAIVAATSCSEATCSYEGIQCSDANGAVFTDTCTNYYVECENGVQREPRSVAEGTKCYNGQQINASQCSSAECSFEGIQCTDANGVYYPDTCTSYFVECDSGKYTAPQPVAAGTRCLRGEQVISSTCSGTECSFEGIQCVDAYGNVETNTCTSYYHECDNGIVTAPRPVAEGTQCYNNEQVNSDTCVSSECSFTGIQCTDANGVTYMNSCTNYYINCENGVISSPHPVDDGMRCLNNAQVDASRCTSTECSTDAIICSDANGEQYTETCTEYYIECDNGKYTTPRPVADGTRCFNGQQILASACAGVQCLNDVIHCSDANGVVYDNECTFYYLLCDDGVYSSPRPVADGTYCLNGELVLPFNCSSNKCDFEGLKCTDAAGTVFDTTCTDYFMECSNGVYSNPMLVPNGAKCLAGSIVMTASCPGSSCSYEGIKCSNADGTIQTGVCSAYYVECSEGSQTKPQSVPEGSRCLNNAIVLQSTCVTPQCSFTGVQCTDSTGVLVNDSCTGYYRECINGAIVGPTATDENTQCYQNRLIPSTSCPCPECAFTGFICSDSTGKLVDNTCTSYFVECNEGKYSSPIAVATGTQCYNQEIIAAGSSICDASDRCSFDSIKCSNAEGTIVTNHCTNFYVMCSNGKVTEPRATAPGTRCYMDEQVIASLCTDVNCSFSGIRCLDSNGDLVMNKCTTRYAECVDNQESVKTVTTGMTCYNSQIVDESTAPCLSVEVQESKIKGIRGRK